ncbi:MAG: hypothetical protein ACRETA_08180 [Gammaproteobacteria bacterium]
MHIKARFLMLVFMTLVITTMTGCLPHSTRPDVVLVPEPTSNQIAQVLDYVNSILSEPPAAQAVAQQKLAAQLKLTQFPEDRMRLALLDALLPEPAGNDAHAVALLSRYNWDTAGPGFKSLAVLMLGVIKTRQANANKIQTLTQQLASEQTQKNHLQQQLDALKSIEKAMNSRDKPIVTPPAAAASNVSATPPGMP